MTPGSDIWFHCVHFLVIFGELDPIYEQSRVNEIWTSFKKAYFDWQESKFHELKYSLIQIVVDSQGVESGQYPDSDNPTFTQPNPGVGATEKTFLIYIEDISKPLLK